MPASRLDDRRTSVQSRVSFSCLLSVIITGQVCDLCDGSVLRPYHGKLTMLEASTLHRTSIASWPWCCRSSEVCLNKPKNLRLNHWRVARVVLERHAAPGKRVEHLRLNRYGAGAYGSRVSLRGLRMIKELLSPSTLFPIASVKRRIGRRAAVSCRTVNAGEHDCGNTCGSCSAHNKCCDLFKVNNVFLS